MHNNSNIRIIKYYIDGNLYYLATNLYDQDEFNIDKLKILYHDRWQVEELFKYIKKYFTFESMQITSIKNINKIIYSELIICRIAELLIKQQKKDGDKIVNKNTLIEGLYDNLLFLICNGKLNYNVKS